MIIGKLDFHGLGRRRKRGYIAMLAVEKEHRKLGIGSELVVKVIEKMRDEGAHEVRQSLID